MLLSEFTERGLNAFEAWISSQEPHTTFPSSILSDVGYANTLSDSVDIDGSIRMETRYDFAKYLHGKLSGFSLDRLLSEKSDAMWGWLSAVFISQLAEKQTRRADNYIIKRQGAQGSVVHRNGPRTAFMLYALHGEYSRIALANPMHSRGQLQESLSAKQCIAINTSCFKVACKLYLDNNGKVRRGASNKAKKRKDRVRGDRSGMGGARRLPLAFERLDRVYDTDVLDAADVIARLPPEYANWKRKSAVKERT